jgi:DNA-binding NarL/FixJ family response regulator
VTVRVLLADDESMIRAGLRMVLDAEPDLVIVGEAADGARAVTAAAALRPDVVLMDVRMPGMDGIAATRRILAADADVKVVVLTTFREDAYVKEALRAGASGFLLKVASPERLVEAIRAAAGGDAVLDPLVTRTVIAAFAGDEAGPPPDGVDRLTAREIEVLQLMARGGSNAQIAADLVVSDATVKTHVARILMKLGLRSRVQAVIYAYDHGLVRPRPR